MNGAIMCSLNYSAVIGATVWFLLFGYGTAYADCKRCSSLEEALQSKEIVESLELLGRLQPSLVGLERLQALESLHINLEGMTHFPKEILSLQNLEQLVLEGNPQLSVDEIARQLQALPKLTKLHFRNFNCPTIPESVLQLTQLEQLIISNSGVKEVPAGIANLSKLYYLNLNDNQLEFLPEEIGQLQNLQVLELQYNRFQSLPEVLEQLQKIYFIMVIGNPLTAEVKEKLKTSKIDYLYVEDDAKKQEPEEPDRR